MTKILRISKLPCLNGTFWHAIDYNHVIMVNGEKGYKTYGLIPNAGDYSDPELPEEFNNTMQHVIIDDGYAVLATNVN